MNTLSVTRLTSTRIPTVDGEFRLALYENSQDDKDHLALLHGDPEGEEDVLVRVHSECFTGDVLGSLRCDCGEQLNVSMRRVAAEGRGIILYLRQEGRGIGLLNKLRAYDLQDEGYDTVEANLMLGHEPDERDYSIGALILKDLDIPSVRLLTNNPEKIESLEKYDIEVTERVPLEPHLNRHNTEYLRTKVERMRHVLDLGPLNGGRYTNSHGADLQALRERAHQHYQETGRPFVTLSYAQSLDGSIATPEGKPLLKNSIESSSLAAELRALHDGILLDVGTAQSRDLLGVRRTDETIPRPVVLDPHLQTPTDVHLLKGSGISPIIATSKNASTKAQRALEEEGATVIRFCCDDEICIDELLETLGENGMESLVVKGGADLVSSFLRRKRVHHVVVAIAPTFVGGPRALQALESGGQGKTSSDSLPRLKNIRYRWFGEGLILYADPVW